MTYPALQALRAVAALSVVYFHSVLQLTGGMGRTDVVLPVVGAWGVDLFFVISGFVMWVSTAGRAIAPSEFYRRRIVRIVPLYWGVTAFACSVALVAPQLLRSTVLDGPHVLASFLFLPWPNPALPPVHADVFSPVVIPGWTLNYEMFFYLLFGLSLLVPERLRPAAVAGLIVAAMTVAALLSPVLPAAAFYASTMLFEFLAGVLIGVFAGRLKWSAPDGLAWVVIGAVAIGLCVAEATAGLSSRWSVLGPLAVVMVCVAVAADRNGVVRNGLMQKLGDASYSIYLVHIFVIAGLRVVLSAAGVRIDGPAGEIMFVVAASAASTGAGYAIYRFFERPTTSLVSRLVLPPRRPVALAS